MYTPKDQKVIDEKIHHFIESKSRRNSWQALKDVFTERFAPTTEQHDATTDITYEQLDWSQDSAYKSGRFRKFAN